jgi:hypothetical protein
MRGIFNMKKIVAFLLIVVLASTALVSCGKQMKEFTAVTQFLYSTDGGENWSQKIQEVTVGETYWVKIQGEVARSIGVLVEKEVEVYITIPSTDIGEYFLDDRSTSIEQQTDAATGETRYTFKTLAGTDPLPYYAIFECTPTKEGRIEITVSYDDRVSDLYTTIGAIKYVSKESDPGETEE